MDTVLTLSPSFRYCFYLNMSLSCHWVHHAFLFLLYHPVVYGVGEMSLPVIMQSETPTPVIEKTRVFYPFLNCSE